MTTSKAEGLERCSLLAHLIGRVVLRLLGWRISGTLPSVPKAVIIAGPHTSNWDFVIGLAIAWSCRLKLSWLGKHTLFKPPFGWFFRAMGGLPVDRTGAQGLVEQLVSTFEKRERLALAVPPSGTRKRRDYWKSGFYHIALGANVPILCVSADYGRKTGWIGTAIDLEGDVSKDMDRIRAFYANSTGKFPALMTTMRLRIEDTDDEASAEAHTS
jgi:1-acyl-sn-glycerol-3-phosphate acyltransferase